MVPVSLAHWRRLLVATVLLASLPALWRLGDVREALWHEQLVVAAFDQGQQLQASGRLAEAVEAFQTAVRYADLDPELYEILAMAQSRLGRIDDSVATYRHILRDYPHAYNAVLYRNVGLIELRAGRFRAARADLLKAVSLDSGDVLAFHLLGHTLAALKDFAGARDAWTRVLELNPGFQPARDRLRELDAVPQD